MTKTRHRVMYVGRSWSRKKSIGAVFHAEQRRIAPENKLLQMISLSFTLWFDMKTVLSLVGLCAVSLMLIGCVSASAILAAADAGLKTYEASVTEGSDQYELADKIDAEVNALSVLYHDAEAASSTSKPGIAAQIAALSGTLATDNKQLLALVAVKNPTKQEIIVGVIASVEAFIVVVQDSYPDPSGNSVQLNSTAAQLKAATL